jgi:hypothetical protein
MDNRLPLLPTVSITRILWGLVGYLIWLMLLSGGLIWMTLYNMVQSPLLRAPSGVQWAQYGSHPLRLVDGVMVIILMGWLLTSLLHCRSYEQFWRRTIGVLAYTLYIGATSPLVPGVLYGLQTGCWYGVC